MAKLSNACLILPRRRILGNQTRWMRAEPRLIAPCRRYRPFHPARPRSGRVPILPRFIHGGLAQLGAPLRSHGWCRRLDRRCSSRARRYRTDVRRILRRCQQFADLPEGFNLPRRIVLRQPRVEERHHRLAVCSGRSLQVQRRMRGAELDPRSSDCCIRDLGPLGPVRDVSMILRIEDCYGNASALAACISASPCCCVSPGNVPSNSTARPNAPRGWLFTLRHFLRLAPGPASRPSPTPSLC